MSRVSKRDKHNAGRSRLVPHVPGEDQAERHARRLEASLAGIHQAKKEAAKRGLSITTFNEGHHWKVTRPGFLAEWWPSSAKLVFNQQWDHAVHAHDWQQVIQEIDRNLMARP